MAVVASWKILQIYRGLGAGHRRVAPLVGFTNSAPRMGYYRNNIVARWFGAIVTLIVGGLNAYLIVISIKDNQFGSTNGV